VPEDELAVDECVPDPEDDCDDEVCDPDDVCEDVVEDTVREDDPLGDALDDEPVDEEDREVELDPEEELAVLELDPDREVLLDVPLELEELEPQVPP